MPTFRVAYTFGAELVVDATDEHDAEGTVEETDTDDLIEHAKNGFEIQGVQQAD